MKKFVVCGSNRENLDEDVILTVDAENGSEALKKAEEMRPGFWFFSAMIYEGDLK